MNKLQKVWNDLDKAYEKMERAIETLSKMDTVTTELENVIEKFDMSEISYMKQLVEEMMENKQMKCKVNNYMVLTVNDNKDLVFREFYISKEFFQIMIKPQNI